MLAYGVQSCTFLGIRSDFLEYIMNMVLASIGTACIAVALGQLIPEGLWIWLAALAYWCCTLTLAFVWND